MEDLFSRVAFSPCLFVTSILAPFVLSCVGKLLFLLLIPSELLIFINWGPNLECLQHQCWVLQKCHNALAASRRQLEPAVRLTPAGPGPLHPIDAREELPVERVSPPSNWRIFWGRESGEGMNLGRGRRLGSGGGGGGSRPYY